MPLYNGYGCGRMAPMGMYQGVIPKGPRAPCEGKIFIKFN